MKRGAACPDFSLLSQFLDQALGEAEAQQLRQHLETCPECRSHVTQVQQMEGAARIELASSSPLPLPARSQKCLSPMQIVSYVHRALSLEEQRRFEQHLHTCNVCLKEVVDTVTIMSASSVTKNDPLPTSLEAQVAAQWQKPQPASLSRLVIQFAQQTAQLLEAYLVAPLLEVEEFHTSPLAFRSGANAAALKLEIVAEQVRVRVTIVQEENGLALRMMLLGPKEQPLAGRRVFLRRQGKVIFSAKTNKAGILQIPRLESRLYDVQCPELDLVFQLEIRS